MATIQLACSQLVTMSNIKPIAFYDSLDFPKFSLEDVIVMNQERFARIYMWSIVVCGSLITLVCLYQLQFANLTPPFILLALFVAISSLVAVPIPRVSGRITVADTFIFLTLLLYGGAAAVVLSALEGVCTTLLISKRPRTILLNASVLALSTFITASV